MESGGNVLTKEQEQRSFSALARQWFAENWELLVVVLAFVFYAARLFRLISRYAVNIFFWDEWDLKGATLFQNRSMWQMFAHQHGWHRLGLGAWVEKLVDPLVRWNSRSESFILGGIVVLAALCGFWLKVRLAGKLSISDVVIPAIFFIPAQWETLTVTPIFSQGPLPFLLIVAYCLAWTCEAKWLRYPLVLLLNVVTTFTGFGMFIGVLTPLLLALDYWSSTVERRLPRIYFAAALLVSLLSVGALFLGYRPTPGLPCFSQFQAPSLRAYAAFMALMAANFTGVKAYGLGSFPRLVGKTVLAVMLISLTCAAWPLVQGSAKMTERERKRRFIVVTLVGLSLTLYATISYLRLCAGYVVALSPRYSVYSQIGMLGLYLHTLGTRRSRMRRVLVNMLAVCVIAMSLHVDHRGMAHFRDIKQRWKSCYLLTEDAARCDQEAGFVIYGRHPEQTHLQEKLQFLKQRRLNLYADSSGP